MSRREEYEQKTEELLLPILEKCQFELIDVEYVKEGMNPILDELDYIDGSYTFEVSSPGLGRPLKKEKDYVRNLGKEIEIRTYRPIQHEKEFRGILKAYDHSTVTIVTKDDAKLSFARGDIALIRQALDF